ncbi:hypothetical protein ACGUFB_04260 [Actinotignum schaalii]|uniref:hypothetical protein n=1 Tax=Actinotignum schaalii TaxID=59505 RepID=UPI00373EB1A8
MPTTQGQPGLRETVTRLLPALGFGLILGALTLLWMNDWHGTLYITLIVIGALTVLGGIIYLRYRYLHTAAAHDHPLRPLTAVLTGIALFLGGTFLPTLLNPHQAVRIVTTQIKDWGGGPLRSYFVGGAEDLGVAVVDIEKEAGTTQAFRALVRERRLEIDVPVGEGNNAAVTYSWSLPRDTTPYGFAASRPFRFERVPTFDYTQLDAALFTRATTLVRERGAQIGLTPEQLEGAEVFVRVKAAAAELPECESTCPAPEDLIYTGWLHAGGKAGHVMIDARGTVLGEDWTQFGE